MEGSEQDDATLPGTDVAIPNEPRTFEAGARIGRRYVVVREIGRGAMGVVLAAYDTQLDREVALKLLKEELPGDGASTSVSSRRLADEAKHLARLSHPNVVSVYDVGVVEEGPAKGSVFLSMEQIRGIDAAQWLERRRESGDDQRRRAWREVLEVFLGAARGLAAAHAAGVLHLDFKPKNVLVGDDGRVRVVDFGLSREVTERGVPTPALAEDAELALSVGLTGTPAYMAPELFGHAPASEASDQFAFCVTLFEALFGARPFRGSTVPELAAHIVRGEPQWPGDAPSVPAWVRRALRRGLSRDPAARFASMRDLIAALQADPMVRARTWAVRGSLALGVLAASYLGWLYTRPGTVHVTAESSGAPCRLQSVSIGEHALKVEGNVASGEVPAGVYRVAVAADGCRPGVDAVSVSRGSEHTVVVPLAHLRGRIDLDVQPEGASVRVDGADHGSRLANLELDTGRYTIEVTKRGHLARTFDVEIRPDETLQQFVYLPRLARWERHASGVNHELRWAGDLTGDGRDDVYHRNFATLSAYDPWTDETLWSLPLPEQGQSLAFVPIENADVDDVVAVWTALASCGVRAVAGRHRGRGQRPLWSLESSRPSDDAIAWMVPAVGLGPGPADAIAVPLPWDKRRVVVVDAKTGQTRWSIDADTAVIGTVGLPDGLFVATRDAVEARDAQGGVRWRRAVALYDDAARDASRGRGEDLMLHRAELAYAAELDGDGVPDLLVGAPQPTASHWLAFAGTDGHPLWSTTLPGWRPGLSTFEPHDADGDGIDDFVVRTHRRGEGKGVEVSVLDGRTGQARWSRAGAGFAMLATAEGPVVPVANADGLALVDAATGEPRLRLGDAQRSNVAPVLADMDADGAPEIVVAQGPSLTFFDLDGREAGRASLSRAVTRLGSPRDADGDGFEDMLADAVGPMVLQATSVRWARTTPHALRSTPVIADFDADGRVDLAVAAHLDDAARLHILDASTGRRRYAGPAVSTIRDLRTLARADGTRDVIAVSHASETLRAMAGQAPYDVRTMAFATSYATPGVGDVTGDGIDDIVVASWEAPAAYLVDGASWTRGWQVDLTQGSFVEPLVVDLDDDATPEVLLGSNDGVLTAVDRDGATLWTRQVGGAKHSYPPALVTLSTGRAGLVVADSAPADEAPPATVLLDGATGEVVLRIEGTGDRAVAVRVVDADDDGVPEILTTKDGAYCSLPLAGGEPNWCHAARSAVDEPIPPYGQPTVFDLDGDGSLEVIVGFAGGELRVLDAATGELRWSYATGFKIEARPLAHDVDGDGLAEVFVASHDGTLCCLGGRPASRGRLSDAHARLDSADTPTKTGAP